MEIEGIAKGLGWFSLGLGAAEIACGRRMARVLGVRKPGLVRFYGAREIASGVALLGDWRKKPWLWSRVIGDALDLATLASSVFGRSRRRQRRNALIAAASVLGITALDLVTGVRSPV